MSSLTDLQAQVAQTTTVEQSAITLIEGLAAQLAAAGTDPAALAKLQSDLASSATALAAAITANTPAAP
jgi:DNA-binding GntR family transcriptional regulator